MTPPPPGDGDQESVRGERSVAIVNVARSVQSRVSGAFAAALMIAFGIAALTWYYAHALSRPAHARALAQSATTTRAQGEMTLPPLGKITAPVSESNPPLVQEAVQQSVEPREVPLSEAHRTGSLWSAAEAAAPVDGGHASAAVAKTPAQLARERRLAGGVFARVSAPGSGQAPPPAGLDMSGTDPGASTVLSHPVSERDEGTLQAMLRPSAAAAVQARLLPTTRFLLPKGAFIDCTLETAIDSTLPGMTTCVTAADSFGADGKVVLLERGSKLVGETRGQVQQGQARVFVVWTEARTPTGVVVPLDSPGTDELGRAGLPGDVERHFWERFGAAMLISVVNGAVQAGVQAANHSGGAVLYAPSTSQDVMTEVLKSTVNIAPTVIKHNGERIQVLVARDLDFRSVYELRAPSTDR
jgi:type IV secretion system protein VirB10